MYSVLYTLWVHPVVSAPFFKKSALPKKGVWEHRVSKRCLEHLVEVLKKKVQVLLNTLKKGHLFKKVLKTVKVHLT